MVTKASHPVAGFGEELRDGSRTQYESEWESIAVSISRDFTHRLGEMPWLVDVIYSEQADGRLVKDASSIVTIVKTESTITITNNDTALRYFQVRAL